MSEGAQQRTIDYARGDQLYLLRVVPLASAVTRDGGTVSGATLKAVLRVLDDHGPGCWISYATMTREIGRRGVKTAKRAVEVLERMSLICVETRMSRAGVVCNHYTIVWNEIDLLANRPAAMTADATTRGEARRDDGRRPPPQRERRPAPCAVIERSATAIPEGAERSANQDERSANQDERSANQDERSATCGTQSALKRKNKPPPTPSSAQDLNAGWRGAMMFLTEAGIRAPQAIVARAQGVGLAPQRLVEVAGEIIATAALPPNARLWRTDAITAAAWRLAHGAWPAEGVVTLDEWRRRAAFQQRRDSERERERAAGELWRRVKELRRDGLDEQAIGQRLRDQWPAELCAREGW